MIPEIKQRKYVGHILEETHYVLEFEILKEK